MTQEEFGRKLKTLEFQKVTTVDGSRGYTTTIQTADGKPYGISFIGAPEMKAKQAFKMARKRILMRLAEEWGYTGSLTSFE